MDRHRLQDRENGEAVVTRQLRNETLEPEEKRVEEVVAYAPATHFSDLNGTQMGE